MIQRLFFVLCLFSLTTSEALAAVIQWNQPEVVQEKLTRDNRRVLQFSGTAPAGTQLRVRDNKVKMIFSKKNIRWARIPQKNRVQFPVIASDTGYFSFQLYLPTVAVEIPLEIFKGGKWVPYRLSFEVPKAGAAEEFKFVEESFKSSHEGDDAKVEDFLSEYDKQEDVGQVVNDRGEWKSWTTGKIQVWGSLGLMYYRDTQTHVPGDELGTISGAGFPAFELGGDWRITEKIKAELSYTNRTGSAKPDGGYTLQNTDFEWSSLDVLGTYYPESLEAAAYRFGIKGGIEMQDIPYLRRAGAAAYRIYTNNMVYLGVGANFETMRAREWNYDVNALFIYPVSAGSELSLDSAWGLDMSFSMLKEIIPALSIGGKLGLDYISMKSTHVDNGPAIPARASSDTKLLQLTPSFVLKAEF